MLHELKFTDTELEFLFPCDDEDGKNVQASAEAVIWACEKLNCLPSELTWHLPDVFSIRYGSNYAATATGPRGRVRFLSTNGEFQEGDDQ